MRGLNRPFSRSLFLAFNGLLRSDPDYGPDYRAGTFAWASP